MGHQALQSSPDSNLLALGHPVLHRPDPRHWIIPHTIYAGGPPPETLVPPAVLSIFVSDILDLGRLARLKTMDMHHVPAFPDPERIREKKKFTVRFAVSNILLRASTVGLPLLLVRGDSYQRKSLSSKRIPQA